MGQVSRWACAGLITAGVFGLCAWICGSVLLPSVLSSEADRWVLAAGAGTAAAAVAALGAASWAMRPADGRAAEGAERAGVSATQGGIALGGDNSGVASTGHDSRITQIG